MSGFRHEMLSIEEQVRKSYASPGPMSYDAAVSDFKPRKYGHNVQRPKRLWQRHAKKRSDYFHLAETRIASPGPAAYVSDYNDIGNSRGKGTLRMIGKPRQATIEDIISTSPTLQMLDSKRNSPPRGASRRRPEVASTGAVLETISNAVENLFEKVESKDVAQEGMMPPPPPPQR